MVHFEQARNRLGNASCGTSVELKSLRIPERSFHEWGIAVLLFTASILYLWIFRSYTAFNADEGIVLQGAQRILRGELVYRDFFSYFTPGSYYWYALLFKIFGSSMLVARTALAIYGGVFSVLTYLLARRVCSRFISLLVVCWLTITVLPGNFVVLHNWDSTLWALFALYCAIWLIQASHWAWALATGTFIALTFLFEQSKGTGVMVGILGALLFITWATPFSKLSHPIHLKVLLSGIAWPLLLTGGYFASQACLSRMLAGWFWPVRHYSAVNWLPYGYLVMSTASWQSLIENSTWAQRFLFVLAVSPYLLIALLPFLAAGFMTYYGLSMRKQKSAGDVPYYYFLVSVVIEGLVFSTVATGRPDVSHLLFLAPPLFLVLGWILESGGKHLPFLSSIQPLLVVCLLASFTMLAVIVLFRPLNAHYVVESRRGVLKTGTPDPVISYVQQSVDPGARIFVYPYQPLLYFLTATYSPTSYEYLQVGLHTSAQFHRALAQLAADRTPVVLYHLDFAQGICWSWPSTPLRHLADDAEAKYIFFYYRPCVVLRWTHGRLAYMVRRDLPCPAPEGRE